MSRVDVEKYRVGHLSDPAYIIWQSSSLVLTPRQGVFGIHHNQMESFNGNTIRAREKVVRGIKKDGSTVLKSMQIHHFQKTTIDGDTLVNRAGIRIKGNNKWKIIIQNASTSPLDMCPRRITPHRFPVPHDFVSKYNMV